MWGPDPLAPTLLLVAPAAAQLPELWLAQQVPESRGWVCRCRRVHQGSRAGRGLRGLAHPPTGSWSGRGLVKQDCGVQPAEREEREGALGLSGLMGPPRCWVLNTDTHSRLVILLLSTVECGHRLLGRVMTQLLPAERDSFGPTVLWLMGARGHLPTSRTDVGTWLRPPRLRMTLSLCP